jgi:hypothetical protein
MEHGIFGGYEVDEVDGFSFELFELHNLQLGMKSGLLFLSFFKKITPLSLADTT